MIIVGAEYLVCEMDEYTIISDFSSIDRIKIVEYNLKESLKSERKVEI